MRHTTLLTAIFANNSESFPFSEIPLNEPPFLSDNSESFPFSEIPLNEPPQWGAADAEVKVPSGENTELKRSPFKAWGKSVYSHTCYAYYQGLIFLAYYYTSGPFTRIFPQNLFRFFLCWLLLTHGSCVGPQNKKGHPAVCGFTC